MAKEVSKDTKKQETLSLMHIGFLKLGDVVMLSTYNEVLRLQKELNRVIPLLELQLRHAFLTKNNHLLAGKDVAQTRCGLPNDDQENVRSLFEVGEISLQSLCQQCLKIYMCQSEK